MPNAGKICSEYIGKCEVCCEGRLIESMFKPLQPIKVFRVMQMVQCDFAGPFPACLLSGAKYVKVGVEKKN